MARKVGKWVAPYKHELKRIKDYARELTKRGYLIDLSFLPETPKRFTEKSVERLKDISAKYLRTRAIREESGVKITAEEEAKIKRSESAKKGWVTRRQQVFQEDFPPESENIFIPGNLSFDEKYYPSEGLISLGNAAKILGAPDDFIEECINTIDNCFYDPLFGKRNIRWVRESTTYGELLTNYLRQILSDEEKTKKAAENVVNAGADDAIFALIGSMMFADSNSPDPPHVSFQNITRIFEGRSYSIPSASEVEEWEDGFD